MIEGTQRGNCLQRFPGAIGAPSSLTLGTWPQKSRGPDPLQPGRALRSGIAHWPDCCSCSCSSSCCSLCSACVKKGDRLPQRAISWRPQAIVKPGERRLYENDARRL
jgi:hypothetical protein